jgi:hypothetical protein
MEGQLKTLQKEIHQQKACNQEGEIINFSGVGSYHRGADNL